MARYWNKYAKKAKKTLFRSYMSIKQAFLACFSHSVLVCSVCLSIFKYAIVLLYICMFFCLPSCTSALSVCLFVCIVYVFKKRNQRVCPTQHLVVYIIKINESVSDCLAPGPRKRENLLYPSGGAGGPAIPLPHPSRQSSYL